MASKKSTPKKTRLTKTLSKSKTVAKQAKQIKKTASAVKKAAKAVSRLFKRKSKKTSKSVKKTARVSNTPKKTPKKQASKKSAKKAAKKSTKKSVLSRLRAAVSKKSATKKSAEKKASPKPSKNRASVKPPAKKTTPKKRVSQPNSNAKKKAPKKSVKKTTGKVSMRSLQPKAGETYYEWESRLRKRKDIYDERPGISYFATYMDGETAANYDSIGMLLDDTDKYQASKSFGNDTGEDGEELISSIKIMKVEGNPNTNAKARQAEKKAKIAQGKETRKQATKLFGNKKEGKKKHVNDLLSDAMKRIKELEERNK